MLEKNTIDLLSRSVLLDSQAFLPELILCVTVVVMLLLRLFNAARGIHLGWLALGCSVLCLVVAGMQWAGAGLLNPDGFLAEANAMRASLSQEPLKRPEIYAGLLIFDNFTLFLRM